ncbi:hypothetical protein EIN_229270 [Entamoeba invadens IP1]|uniref:Uncharacterized protein n=1 Tax=Entamoeba invadens IP1 TaxID=370355 RepID=A0A0A1U302_ENTIV|nr:hypothetical protein EIN_229270 [Entamoeba invadens IP1]ELP88404.1 hypothetical protein EIN_229270 [Entamoeba invadens IP1]|eukprot:XP_004255175.1 hypothetical protein EIN_229270 [Entamoeba invadens IP1]
MPLQKMQTYPAVDEYLKIAGGSPNEDVYDGILKQISELHQRLDSQRTKINKIKTFTTLLEAEIAPLTQRFSYSQQQSGGSPQTNSSQQNVVHEKKSEDFSKKSNDQQMFEYRGKQPQQQLYQKQQNYPITNVPISTSLKTSFDTSQQKKDAVQSQPILQPSKTDDSIMRSVKSEGTGTQFSESNSSEKRPDTFTVPFVKHPKKSKDDEKVQVQPLQKKQDKIPNPLAQITNTQIPQPASAPQNTNIPPPQQEPIQRRDVVSPTEKRKVKNVNRTEVDKETKPEFAPVLNVSTASQGPLPATFSLPLSTKRKVQKKRTASQSNEDDEPKN